MFPGTPTAPPSKTLGAASYRLCNQPQGYPLSHNQSSYQQPHMQPFCTKHDVTTGGIWAVAQLNNSGIGHPQPMLLKSIGQPTQTTPLTPPPPPLPLFPHDFLLLRQHTTPCTSSIPICKLVPPWLVRRDSNWTRLLEATIATSMRCMSDVVEELCHMVLARHISTLARGRVRCA